jgi:putative PIN family toxin of toxin-antitoxin system
MAGPIKIVVDTSVLIAALRSESGAAAELLRRILRFDVTLMLSYALLCEYKDVAFRPEQLLVSRFSADEIDGLLSRLEDLAEALPHDQSHRPLSTDPNDDVVLEAAINGDVQVSVTHNIRHLRDAAARFRIEVKTPGEFLESLRKTN